MRCTWCTDDADYIAYHDGEWGRPVHDDRHLFELIILEGMQAGLSWLTILKKRPAFRRALCDFEPERVAAFDENDAIIGTSKSGKPIMHLSRLGEVCRRDQIKIGIITVPAEQAQGVCDLLISNGILAIWNFAPKHLNVPDHILVQNENMAASLALLCKHLNEQMKAEE